MANLDMTYDLTLDEARRRAAVLQAIADDWDPVAVLAEEELAYLPDRSVRRAAN
jgi:hypothetical protein